MSGLRELRSWLLALIFLLPFSVLAAEWSLQVKRIEVGGDEVASSAVQITKAGSTQLERRQISPGDRFLEGTTLLVPARTLVMLESSNGNVLRLLPSSRLKITAGSVMGEEYEQEAGEGFFDVKRALNFFNVRYRSFQAIVKGTRYSVKVDPEKSITIAVEEGVVKLEREGKLRIDEVNTEGSITVAEWLKAGESKSYRLDMDEYLARFTHYGEAEAYYRENLARDRASKDPERIERGLNQLGIALITLSRYQEAIPYLEKALGSLRKRRSSGGHNDIASVLTNLGIAYRNQGGTENVQRAIEYYEEALIIRRALFPSGAHNDIAGVLTNLGVAHSDLGGTENVQRAIEYYEEALKIRRALFPSGVHNDIASVLTNLGIAYRNLGGTENVERAIGYYEEALKIRRALFPSGVHNGIASGLANLGNAYSDLGGTENVQRAIGYCEEALKIQRQLFPSGHGGIAGFLGGLAYHRLFVGQHAQSLQDSRAALAMAPDQTWLLTNEAHALLLLGRLDEALDLYRRYRDASVNASQSFRDVVLDDFAALRKAGVSHPDMAVVEALYGKSESGVKTKE